MADKNTTRKDPLTKEIVEEGQSRCKRCMSRLTVVSDSQGTQRLWCFHCESPTLGRNN